MTNSHRYYAGFIFPHTRQQARLLMLLEVMLGTPIFVWQIVRLPTRPLVDFGPIVIIVVAVFSFAFKALHHLGQLEREHPEPTPVMSFLLQVAVALPMLGFVTIGDLLTAYAR